MLTLPKKSGECGRTAQQLLQRSASPVPPAWRRLGEAQQRRRTMMRELAFAALVQALAGAAGRSVIVCDGSTAIIRTSQFEPLCEFQ